MKRLVWLLSALSCALFLALPARAQSANVTGDWDVTINSPQGARAGSDSMKGDADFGGFAQGDWNSKRASATAALSAPAAAASSSGQKSGDKVDVTGSWSVSVETEAGSGNPSFTLKQEGEKLTGRYKGAFGEADLTGTVKGDKIEFSFKVSGQLEGTITYSGTTDGKTMKGKVNLAGAGEGTFSGKKD